MPTFGWNMLDGKQVFVQRLLGVWHYWTFEDGWLVLDSEAEKRLIPCEEA